MLRFFRHIRKKLILQENVKKYIFYALGEILLVMIGILLALQVNNWNQERIEDELLWGYLQNIRTNIQDDLKKARETNYVYDQIESGTPEILNLIEKGNLSLSELGMINSHFDVIINMNVYNVNTSGFEALKNTGAIAGIQGTHMETLLNSYYRETSAIETELQRERDRIDYNLQLHGVTEWGYTFTDWFKLNADPSHFNNFSGEFIRMASSNIAQEILARAFYNNFDEYYAVVERIGSILTKMIEDEELYTTEQNMQLISFLDLDTTTDGIEDVVVNGSYPTSLNLIIESSLGLDGISAQANTDHLSLNFKEEIEWGAAIFVVDSIGISSNRPGKDFSGFSSVELELKGDSNGKEVFFSIKDRDDPDDGSETRVRLELNREWTTYRFSTNEFTTAELSQLNAVAIFVVMSGEPVRLDVKRITYIPNFE